MDRRLIQAYDGMTMPDGCSQRIESLLMEGVKPVGEREYRMILNQRPSRRGWVRAAALVCLVMAFAIGATAIFLNTQVYQSEMLPVFDHPEETTIPRETMEDPFPYGDEGESFLEKMCHVMPEWDGYASLDDVFWTEFTVRLLNDFTYGNPQEQSGQVTTPAGEALFFDGAVHMKREVLSAFIQEIMGYELPEFNPSGEYLDRISYVNGTYSVVLTEFPRLRYERLPSTKSDRETYQIYREADQAAVGNLTFSLRDEENQLGFIILGRTTTLSLTEIEEPEIASVAQSFAEAYFANDIEGMKAHLSRREDSSLLLNLFVTTLFSNGEESLPYQLFGVRVFAWEGDMAHPVAYVDYACELTGEMLYPNRSLVLDMVQTEEGWKVRSFTDQNPESYDPDREEIFDVVDSYVLDYLDGEISWAEDHWASDRMELPAYDGEAEDLKIQNITIYFDPLGETNDLGELMADAYVEIRESEKAPNPLALYLHLVKRGSEWKIDSIGEG